MTRARFAGPQEQTLLTMSEGGYGKPPLSRQFPKGVSGNPNGRPPGRHNLPPYDAVLGQMVTIKEDGRERQVTAAEAFILLMTKRGLDGDGTAARLSSGAIEAARDARLLSAREPLTIVVKVVAPGSVNSALERLRMAKKLDRYRPSARMLLEPWFVTAALARPDQRRLSREEQAIVVRAVRTPHKVQWPDR